MMDIARFICTFVVLVLNRVCTATKKEKPHLLLVLQDDMGHWDTAFNGNNKMQPVTKNVHINLSFCLSIPCVLTFKCELCARRSKESLLKELF